MSNKNQSFKDAIKRYLDQRAAKDEQFAKTYAKQGKTLDECCRYIIGEAKKRGGSSVVMADEEVYGLAVHYYDEDDIQVNPVAGCRTGRAAEEQKVELTEAEKDEARRRAIERLTQEQYDLLRKKPHKARKESETDVQQMSLF